MRKSHGENNMALGFNQQKGKAIKTSVDSYKMLDGDNSVRIVGDILPRYVYWVKGENDKNLPLECLSFDREKEAFTNIEKDWVKTFYPQLKCGWAYATQIVVPDPESESGYKVQVINLKKKLWEQVQTAAEDLGDPTDPTTGWDLKFKKVKTGAQAYNVEYQLQSLRCKSRPLNEGELAAVAEIKSMDDVMPRPTPDAQKELLDRINGSASPDSTDEDAIEEEFDVS
jgi:hypothetical protein